MTTNDLPLRFRTEDAWAAEALADPLALLNDHAHLEKKAATNALDLLSQWPDPTPPESWVAQMAAIARDETEHLAVVTRLLSRRGGVLTKHHRNPYASALRSHVRSGRGPEELMDRLMVSALIEARSCERFEILSRCCGDDAALARLYAELWASEKGHYAVFLEQARRLPLPGRRGAEAVDRRWDEWLVLEAGIIAAQAPGPRMHSGPPTRAA